MALQQSAYLFSARKRAMTVEGTNFSLEFDIVTSENHSWKLKVTTHVVEEGSPFTDHIHQELRKGALVGLVSNHSLKRGALASNYAQDMFDKLESYKENAIPVTIATTMKLYENYIISSMNATRNGQTGEVQSFSISFQEYRTISLAGTSVTAVIAIPEAADIDETQADPNADVGEQNPEEDENSPKLQRFFSSDEGLSIAGGLF